MKLTQSLVVGSVLMLGIGNVPMSGNSANAQVTKQGAGFLLRMKFVPGQVMKYNVNMSMTMGKGAKPMNQTMPITMKVLSVQKGIATIETMVDPRAISKDAQVQKATIKMDNRGNVVEGAASSQLANATYPQGPIRVGQSWKQPISTGGMKMNSTYTFKGVKNVGGRSVADLGISFSSQGGGAQSMSGTGNMLISTADGSLVNSTIKMSMGSGAQAGSMNMTMKRTN